MCCCEMVPLQTASWKVLDSSIYTFLLLCVSMFREMHKNRLNRGNAILEVFSSLNLNLIYSFEVQENKIKIHFLQDLNLYIYNQVTMGN